MPKCPQCGKQAPDDARQCPSCQAELDLIADFVGAMKGRLDRADGLVRAGNLGEAIWTYLEVLETDPDNPIARRQVGRLAAAVRHFDLSSPERRRLAGLPPLDREPWWRKVLELFAWREIGIAAVAFSLGILVALILTTPQTARRGAGGDAEPKAAPGMKEDRPL